MFRPLILRSPNIDRDISIKSYITFGDKCLPILRGKPSSFKIRLGKPTYDEKIIYFNMENIYASMRDLVEYD